MLTTPIDAHLPLVIALVLVCAWVVRGSRWVAAVQCAVPLLIVAMMTITDERTRLLAYGVVVAVFQWGWGANLIGLGKAGPIDAWAPMMDALVQAFAGIVSRACVAQSGQVIVASRSPVVDSSGTI